MKGIELSYSQQLTFFTHELLRGTSVFGTYSRFTSNPKPGGFVPQSASGGLTWRYRRFNANFSGIWSDESITGVNGVPANSRYWPNEPEYLANRFVFDASAGYRFGRHTTIFISGRNVTNSGKTWYHKADDRIRQMERYGAQWTVGVKGSYLIDPVGPALRAGLGFKDNSQTATQAGSENRPHLNKHFEFRVPRPHCQHRLMNLPPLPRRDFLKLSATGAALGALGAMSASFSHAAAPKSIRLIVRGDDMGFSHSGNDALIKCYREGIESSIEVIAPSPWFPEAARLLMQPENIGIDVGVHLALTSEWDNVKVAAAHPLPQSGRSPTAISSRWFGRTEIIPVARIAENKWKLDEIEREFRAQIELVRKHVPRVSHVSGHMGC